MKRLLFIIALFSCLAATSVSAQILAQVFRNTACGNCRTPDDQYASFIDQFTGATVEVVYMHTSFPTPLDPFYKASKTDVNFISGSSFYNVQADPDVFINGYEAGVSFATWKTTTQTAAQTSLPGTLTVSAVITKAGKIQVNLHVDGSSGGKKVKPYAMLVESGLYYDNTYPQGYGNPTNNIWNNIFRAMLPSFQGGNEFTLSGPQDISLPLFDTTGKSWNLANCKIIAYLQETNVQSDNRSYQIDALGTGPFITASVGTINSNGGSSISAPIPNPSTSSAQIPFHLAAPANVRIVVCDDLGREVETIFNRFAEGSSFASFTPANLSRGIYYARMFADGAFVGMQKIVFAP